MKNKLMLVGVLASLVLPTTNVDATGVATVEFTGEDNIEVGETFEVYMNVANVQDTYDGVVSLGGNISFDETKIEYVSSKGTQTPYLFQINEDYNYRIAGLDFTLDNGIYENTVVYEFTFKALETGNTTITLENAKLTDSKEYISTNVVAKEINISTQKETIQETTEITEEKKEKVDLKEKTQEDKKTQTNTKTTKENLTEEEIETIQLEQIDDVTKEIEKIEIKEIIFNKINTVFSELFKNIFHLFK